MGRSLILLCMWRSLCPQASRRMARTAFRAPCVFVPRFVPTAIQSSWRPVAAPPARFRFSQASTPSSPHSDQSDTLLELGDDMVLSVGQFKGNVLVHVRQYWVDKKTNERRPGKRGITLRASDVERLEGLFDDIDMDLQRLSSEQGDFDKQYDLKLSHNRKVSVHMKQSVRYVKLEHEAMSGP